MIVSYGWILSFIDGFVKYISPPLDIRTIVL